ncbi:MAG: hypothetical protein ACJAR3_002661 [Roseivirga sp.]|jgi:hypothetical protein
MELVGFDFTDILVLKNLTMVYFILLLTLFILLAIRKSKKKQNPNLAGETELVDLGPLQFTKLIHRNANKLIQWHESRQLAMSECSRIKTPKVPKGETKNINGFIFNTVSNDQRSIEDRYSALVLRVRDAVSERGQFNTSPRNFDTNYYDSRWSTKRNKIARRDKDTCQVCGLNNSGIINGMNVHHLWYSGDGWEVPDSALILLCKSCHDETHGCDNHILNPKTFAKLV